MTKVGSDRWIERALHADDYDLKQRLARSIDLLYELGGELPPRINEKRRQLAADGTPRNVHLAALALAALSSESAAWLRLVDHER